MPIVRYFIDYFVPAVGLVGPRAFLISHISIDEYG